MPYSWGKRSVPCAVCGFPANAQQAVVQQDPEALTFDCSRCGDFALSPGAAFHLPRVFGDDVRKKALASYVIRKSNTPSHRPFFMRHELEERLKDHALPSLGVAADNLLLIIGRESEGNPSQNYDGNASGLAARIGVVTHQDVQWIAGQMIKSGLLEGQSHKGDRFLVQLTFDGWRRFQELQRETVVSKSAFFARRFQNPDLDLLYRDCLWPAVKATGYDLNIATQKAGNIDMIVEHEIRVCRFLIADLSDNNEGAYWEAGFAEGLGKPVIYICKDDVKTHFDTEHRHTVRWSPDKLDDAAARLKAVIRNTLLGDAKQSDD